MFKVNRFEQERRCNKFIRAKGSLSIFISIFTYHYKTIFPVFAGRVNY